MTSKKRKYGDLSARPLPTEDASLLDDVFAAFTGKNAANKPLPPMGIPQEGIPQDSMPQSGIPSQGIPQANTLPAIPSKKLKPSRFGGVSPSGDRGYYPTFNDLDDLIIPEQKLDTFEQSVLRRLYRLSRGFKSLDCEAGLGALAKSCNMARSKVQKTIASLLARGLVQVLGTSQDGTRYRVLEQLPAIPLKGIPQEGIPQNDEGIPQTSAQGIPQGGNNKYNKDLINTHTKTGGGGV